MPFRLPALAGRIRSFLGRPPGPGGERKTENGKRKRGSGSVSGRRLRFLATATDEKCGPKIFAASAFLPFSVLRTPHSSHFRKRPPKMRHHIFGQRHCLGLAPGTGRRPNPEPQRGGTTDVSRTPVFGPGQRLRHQRGRFWPRIASSLRSDLDSFSHFLRSFGVSA